MGSAVPEGGRPANIHEFSFQAAKRSLMNFAEVEGVYFLKGRKGIFRLGKI